MRLNVGACLGLRGFIKRLASREATITLHRGQVLRMADRLQVPRVIAAVGAALAAAGPLPWETALAVWALPPGCADIPAYAPVFDAAAAALQERFGDLDAALNNATLRDELLLLPLPALLRLLRDPTTRAVSENTVVWICDAWLSCHIGGSEEEQAALAACLRLQHLTPLYVASVVSRLPWLQRRVDLHLLAMHATVVADVPGDGLLGCFKPLAAAERPKSRLQDVQLDWDFPLEEVRALHARVLDLPEGSRQRVFAKKMLAIWGGYSWTLKLTAHRRSGGVFFGVRGVCMPPPSCKGQVVVAFAAAKCTNQRRRRVWDNADIFYCKNWDGGFGSNTTLGLSRMAAWDEAAWRNAGLVDGDAVHLRVDVSEAG